MTCELHNGYMTIDTKPRVSAATRACALVLLLVCVAQPAAAFFPFGGSPMFVERIRFIEWRLADFDTNGDGRVEVGEGLDITLEGGEFGWTTGEMQIIEEALDVWENVPGAFVAFRDTFPIVDPAEVSGNLGIDGLNLIAVQVEGDFFIDSALTGGVLGIANINFLIDDGVFATEDGTLAFELSGGRIFEADIVINGAAHRGAGALSLKGTMVHEIGHILGLGHNPMNNLRIVTDPATGDIIEVIESAIFTQRDESGVRQQVGVTPTMFPFVFNVENEDGSVASGTRDLAPDDIAAIINSYPRSDNSLDNFFMIAHQARNQVRPSFPSTPILGGLVIAWCDHDDNLLTSRIPLLSTLTGLYEFNEDIFERGQFQLRGMPKVIEHVDQPDPFAPTYTLTIEPMNGFRLPFQPPEAFDSTHGIRSDDAWQNVDYDTVFPSQVFHESLELFGRDNKEAGTPLVFDAARGRVVNANDGRTLSQMLPSGQPMFGDRDDTCPFLVTDLTGSALIVPTVLRHFRDGFLLKSSAGVAVADVYYQLGPGLARYLRQHPWALTSFQAATETVGWFILHTRISILLALLLGLGIVRRYRPRLTKAAAVSALALGFILSSSVAHGALLFLSESEIVAESDAIVEGTVTSIAMRLINNGRSVFTDIQINVDDSLKGRLNKSSTILLSIHGGRLGDVGSFTTDMPRFVEGESMILFLTFVEGHGFSVTGGAQGKRPITFNKKADEKRVAAGYASGQKNKSDPGSGADDSEEGAGTLPLEEYKELLRDLVRRQR